MSSLGFGYDRDPIAAWLSRSGRKAKEVLSHGPDATGEVARYIKKFARENPIEAAAMATAPVPVLGDVMGAVADAKMYASEPESRTLGNAAMTALGFAPFIPSVAGMTRKIPEPIDQALREAREYGKSRNPDAPDDWLESGPYVNLGHEANLYRLGRYVDEELNASSHGKGFWRGTNRPDELDDLNRGVAIVSRNHVDNRAEKGMSVAADPGYIVMQDYPYGYRVTGELAGIGSDGEPLLINAKPTTKVLKPKQIAAEMKKVMQAQRQTKEVLAQRLGLRKDFIDKLVNSYHPSPDEEYYRRFLPEQAKPPKRRDP